jgi:hypothetical protein
MSSLILNTIRLFDRYGRSFMVSPLHGKVILLLLQLLTLTTHPTWPWKRWRAIRHQKGWLPALLPKPSILSRHPFYSPALFKLLVSTTAEHTRLIVETCYLRPYYRLWWGMLPSCILVGALGFWPLYSRVAYWGYACKPFILLQINANPISDDQSHGGIDFQTRCVAQ